MANQPPAKKYEHPKRPVPSNSVERRRKKLPENSRRRRLFDTTARPVEEPREFTVDPKVLATQLMPTKGSDEDKAARSAEILQQAQSIYQEAEDRAAGVAARATTLQEAVGIAATLLITGAGLIVGQTALHGKGWVLLFAVLLFGATISLVMSGLRALSAASTIHQWYRPTAGDIVERAQIPAAEARLALAADILYSYGYNTKVASWKVAYLGAAAWWYRIALAFIVSIAMLVGVYAVVQANQSTGIPATPAATTSTTEAAPATSTTGTGTTTSTRHARCSPRQRHRLTARHGYRSPRTC